MEVLTGVRLRDPVVIAKVSGDVLLSTVVDRIPTTAVIAMAELKMSYQKLGDDGKEMTLKNGLYNKHYINNETKNFCERFSKLGDSMNYVDSKIWESQFGKDNQLYIVEDDKGQPYIIVVIFLDDFHSDVKKIAIEQKVTLKEYVKTYHDNVKDILRRNARRKIALFCSENTLGVDFKYDAKSKEVKGYYPPIISELVQCEFINDLKVVDSSVVLSGNSSFHSSLSMGHLKLYSDKKFEWLGDRIDETLISKYNGVMVYTNLSYPVSEEKKHSEYEVNKQHNAHVLYDIDGSLINVIDVLGVKTKKKMVHENDLEKLYGVKKELKVLYMYK